ncbi:hypothetical protein O77CONTIG1_00075 [Leptolyngbya sp. O-77]|nr:hypothetical protein O77CONTIG1_00075 [Leptolyngbya sp. O-77]
MQLREPTSQLTGVAETLMITLCARAHLKLSVQSLFERSQSRRNCRKLGL